MDSGERGDVPADKSIYITGPCLPPLNEFIPCLEKIRQAKILTGGGPFHRQLEAALRDFPGGALNR